jgi:hypothetical protein
MATRTALCHCGQLRLEVDGEPLDVSICNCLACQRRTGSAFGIQAAFTAGQVKVLGRTDPSEPDLVVVSVGSFADPSFPPPTESSYDSRRHPWVGLPDSIQRHAPELWDAVRPLYKDGKHAEAADAGLELIEAHPEQSYLYYNVACCESLAGRSADAVAHLRQAIDRWEAFREMANADSDFDPIRDEAAFQELVAVGTTRP